MDTVQNIFHVILMDVMFTHYIGVVWLMLQHLVEGGHCCLGFFAILNCCFVVIDC